MTQDHQDSSSTEVDTAEAGFQRLRDQAEASGIPQDVPLDSGRFLAGIDRGVPPISLGQLREIAGGVRAALALAQGAAAEFTRDEDAASVDQIVKKLQEVVDGFPVVPGQPL